MRNILSNRREAYSEIGATPESIRPIKVLQEAGILSPLEEQDLYHGRSGDGNRWKVQELDNAGNNTGNRNINKIPGLHASRYDVAMEFAEARTNRQNRRGDKRAYPEVHKITSNDPDASIIDCDFEWSDLSTEQYRDVKQAISDTLPEIFEGAPLNFTEREAMRGVSLANFTKNQKYGGFISQDMVAQYARENQIPEDLAGRVSGALNAKWLLGNYPKESMQKVVDAFFDNTGEATLSFGSQIDSFPIDKEYVATWLQKMHVVGKKMWVRSATLGGKVVPTYVMFDHEHINTETENKQRRDKINKRLGNVAYHLTMNNAYNKDYKSRSPEKLLRNKLADLYVKPEELVQAAQEVPGYREVFDADAGNWEKFSLGEHTETVLRLFDYNYADKLPATILPVMRLGLLVHDLGKPLAAQHGKKDRQMEYNLPAADGFMRSIGIEKRARDFVLNLIGPGKETVGKYVMGGRNERRTDDVSRLCADIYTNYTGKPASRDDINGVFDLCLVMQTCDSAAYTDMALTRSKEKDGLYYRNYPVFNKSFKGSQGMTRRKARLN